MESEFGWLVFLLMVFPCDLMQNVNIVDLTPIELDVNVDLPEAIIPERYEITISSDIEDPTPFYEGVVCIKVQYRHPNLNT